MFKVGDEVIVTSDSYGITTEGSVGKVIKVNPYGLLIHFTLLTSGEYGKHDFGQPMNCYSINLSDVQLLHPVNPHLAVIAKIKEMEARRMKLKKTKVKKSYDVVAPYF